MTTALGIASVSVVLVDLLNNGLIDDDVGAVVGSDVTVSALPPDRILPASGNAEKSQLNLFLYSVTPNIGWRNIGQPARNSRGERISNPPLALDLHYLLSAYGEKDFHAEILLGHGMQLLHEHPILARQEIEKALTAPSPTDTTTALPASLRELSKSELAEQLELIKITHEPLTTEEISKLWAAFQTHYRATAAYEATVVLIESKRPTRRPLPVRGRHVEVRAFRRPHVDAIEPVQGPGAPIVADTVLAVRGNDLAGRFTVVRIGDVDLEPPPANVGGTEVRVALAGANLPAGVHRLRVLHEEPIDGGPARRRVAESNVGGFALRPRIPSAPVATVTSTSGGLHRGTIAVGVDPHAREGQRPLLLLNELRPLGAPAEPPPTAFSFSAGRLEQDASAVDFAFDRLPSGTYLVRVQIDGAESPVALGASGRYETPQVVIP